MLNFKNGMLRLTICLVQPYIKSYLVTTKRKINLEVFLPLLEFPGGTSFVDHLCYLCLVLFMLSHLLIAALWSPAGKGLTCRLLFVMFNCVFVTFPCGILGQVWYLIVSIPDLCHISYIDKILLNVFVFRGKCLKCVCLCFLCAFLFVLYACFFVFCLCFCIFVSVRYIMFYSLCLSMLGDFNNRNQFLLLSVKTRLSQP